MKVRKYEVMSCTVDITLPQAEAEVLLAILSYVNVGEPVSDKLCDRLMEAGIVVRPTVQVDGQLTVTYDKGDDFYAGN